MIVLLPVSHAVLVHLSLRPLLTMDKRSRKADQPAIHTPSCIWRRTGEIQKANQEFANLLQIPASMFRNGQLCVYELMDEDSAVRYWEGYGKIAFDAGKSLSPLTHHPFPHTHRSYCLPCVVV